MLESTTSFCKGLRVKRRARAKDPGKRRGGALRAQGLVGRRGGQETLLLVGEGGFRFRPGLCELQPGSGPLPPSQRDQERPCVDWGQGKGQGASPLYQSRYTGTSPCLGREEAGAAPHTGECHPRGSPAPWTDPPPHAFLPTRVLPTSFSHLPLPSSCSPTLSDSANPVRPISPFPVVPPPPHPFNSMLYFCPALLPALCPNTGPQLEAWIISLRPSPVLSAHLPPNLFSHPIS